MPEADFKRKLEQLEPFIQKNDVLSVTVNSSHKKASMIFDTTYLELNQQASAASTFSPSVWYLVDQDDKIKFHYLER